ncbi:hypothetical protein BST61_g6289 [Cercospora zeina]
MLCKTQTSSDVALANPAPGLRLVGGANEHGRLHSSVMHRSQAMDVVVAVHATRQLHIRFCVPSQSEPCRRQTHLQDLRNNSSSLRLGMPDRSMLPRTGCASAASLTSVTLVVLPHSTHQSRVNRRDS